MRYVKQAVLCGALVAAIGFAAPAQAAEYLGTFEGNDCGQGISFDNCFATQGGVVAGPLPAGVSGTPAIVKYQGNDGTYDEANNDLFPSVSGSEISVLYDALTNILSFTYTPGPGDPEIHYFSIKQANLGYVLFYDAAAILAGSVDLDDYFASNPGYSHITFYDTNGGTGGGGGGGGVPEPTTWAMMLLGFGGMGVAMRRRRRSGSVLPQAA